MTDKEMTRYCSMQFIAPIVLFVVMYLKMGLPVNSVITPTIYLWQYVMIIATIGVVPFLLWLVRPERMGEKYNLLALLRMVLFEGITLADVCMYFLFPNITFFYLAVITFICMCFARK